MDEGEGDFPPLYENKDISIYISDDVPEDSPDPLSAQEELAFSTPEHAPKETEDKSPSEASSPGQPEPDLSSGEEFVSPLDSHSSSNLHEVELDPQPRLQETGDSPEQVIRLAQRTDSPLPGHTSSPEDSDSNFSPTMTPSSSNEAMATPEQKSPSLRSLRRTGTRATGLSSGQMVWAKVSGFRFWPGLIVDAASATNLPSQLRTPFREGWLLVHFFGTYDYAWVPPKSCIVSWYLGNKKGYMNKCKSKFFQLALSEANRFKTEGLKPAGFSAIPQLLESGSDSDSVHSVETHGAKPRSLKRKLSGKNMAAINIKKIKLSSYLSPGSPEQTRSSRRRCELVMKRMGLVPPDPLLGKKLPEKVNTDPDIEL